MISLAESLIPAKTRTRYLKSIKEPTDNLLKSGANNKKLGGKVTAKMWKGMPLYSLTLEERASCPSSCEQWDNCYGDNMPFAHRYDHTHPDFLPKLRQQLNQLNNKHTAGFVVRLHVLGDFYSEGYINQWRRNLNLFQALRVFGYTHHKQTTYLGGAIQLLNKHYPERFKIRFSDDLTTDFSALTTKTAKDTSKGIFCPEQTGKTDSCAACGYCWTSNRPVIFVEH